MAGIADVVDYAERIASAAKGPEALALFSLLRIVRLQAPVVDAARAYSEARGGCDNPDVPLTCAQTEGEPLCFWCRLDAALVTYAEKERE